MPGGDNIETCRAGASRGIICKLPAPDGLVAQILGKSYRDTEGARHEVLGDVRFTATRGEILAFLAPSGTGKTTILRIVLGLDRDFEGAMRLPEGRIGVMFQEPRLLPWLTVGANLRLIAGDATAEIAAMLAEVGLAGTEALHPKALSLGMARRVALVRALLGHPAVLVLDEPFASLDPKSAAGIAQMIARTAHQDGALVLLSTHNLDPVLGCADRVLVLAGKPARLAADWPTSAREPASNGARGRLFKQRLLLRFPFLGAETEADEPP
ncbi:MAG: ABC transporter ATP-binding protein [Acetobacteraceae bacterium]